MLCPCCTIFYRCTSDAVIESELSDALKGAALGLLQQGALREDVLLLIVHDPQQHVVRSLHQVEKKPAAVQERLVKIVSIPILC